MDRKRQIVLTAATVAIAMGAGHLVQQSAQSSATAASVAPTGIVTLSAKAEPEATALPAPVVATATATVAKAPPRVEPVAPIVAAAPFAITQAQAAVDAAPVPVQVAAAPATDAVAALVALAAADPVPVAPAPEPPAVQACTSTLTATPLPGAVLSLALVAPCDGGARVVLRHGGLAVTARLSEAGTLFTTLPAMDAQGEVSALFPDGARAEAAAAVDMTGIRRFAVQWQGDDAFQVQAYENGAQFGAPGHVSAATPVGEGQLAVLGDASVDLPLMAEVYTFPVSGTPVNVTIEAAVTDKTCARELLGEAVESDAGRVTTTEITLAMPDCSGVGDFLVLNNLFGGTTLAAAD